MFIMMNAARYAVGVQGIAVAERAYQKAVAYARERVQSRPVDGSLPGAAAIIHHPDVQAHADDDARASPKAAARWRWCRPRPTTPRMRTLTPRRASATRPFYEFMVPLIKGYSTEMSLEVASLGVQVHGGMGFIEETGAAQHLRDARILTIYEGTTAIQANDLVGRKTARDGGAVARAIAAQIEDHRRRTGRAHAASMRARMLQAPARGARRRFSTWSAFVVERGKTDPERRVRRQRAVPDAGRQPDGRLADGARAAGGRSSAWPAGEQAEFMRAKIRPRASMPITFSARVPGLRDSIVDGAAGRDRHGPGGVLMALPPILANLPLPIIGAPLFIVSNPKLVIAQCTAGIVGSMPALNARPAEQLDEWLAEITRRLWRAWNRNHPDRPAAPFAINQIVHKSNDRLEHDMQVCAKYKVPIIITSLGARTDVNDAVHGWGGIVLHDIINNTFAPQGDREGRRRSDRGRRWRRRPCGQSRARSRWCRRSASGSMGRSRCRAPSPTVRRVLAAQAMGADLAYIGSAFIATEEARATEAYKQCIVECSSDDIVYSSLFTGVHGNYLKPSIRNAGMDPDSLPEGDVSRMNFSGGEGSKGKAWKDIWGCGQGIAAVKAVVPARELVARLRREYDAARSRFAAVAA